MPDYLKPQKIIAEYLYFHFKGHKYSGRGAISWEPESGFRLEAFLENPLEISGQLEIGRIRVLEPSDYCSIRIWHNDFGWALIPSVNLSSFQTDLLQRNLSFKFSRLLLCESAHPSRSSSSWSGSALYSIKSRNLFRDRVVEQTHVEGEQVAYRQSQGFQFEKDGAKLIGRFINNSHFHLNWILPKQGYSKSEAWRWTVGFQDALSICLGETVQLLKRTMLRGTQKITETTKEERVEKLSTFLSLFGNTPIQKELTFHLANFMSGNHRNKVVCMSIFEQIVEANNQKLQASQELLVATTLEAAMRTLYDYPAHPKDNSSGLMQHTLSGRFKGEYLSKDWREACTKALDAFKRLRIRNAHPDWLAVIDPSSPEANRAEAMDDIIYLCRFYGYMILALSGFKGLQPSFPKPLRNWQPAATITPELDSSFPDIPSPFDGLSEDSSRYVKMIAKRRFDKRISDKNRAIYDDWMQKHQQKKQT